MEMPPAYLSELIKQYQHIVAIFVHSKKKKKKKKKKKISLKYV